MKNKILITFIIAILALVTTGVNTYLGFQRLRN